jgi:adenosine deaminase
MRDLAQLPKGHLHLHLEGAMRTATLHELAERDGLAVPKIAGYGNFGVFAATYVAATKVIKSPDDLARIAREVVADAADHGAVYVEPAFYPANRYDHLGGDQAAVEIVLAAGFAEAADQGIAFGLMLSADRTTDVAEAVGLAHLAVSLRDRGIVAFGLANDETGWPPAPFEPAFAIARAGGLLSTPHAGELAGPESVRDALDFLGADRVQHGVRAIEDPDLIARVADSGVCFDVCPSSNVLLSVVPSMAEHPLPALLAAGVRCSLNSDDPLLFGPSLLDEYEICRTELGLDDIALAGIARASLECSGAPKEVVLQGVAGIDAWLAT